MNTEENKNNQSSPATAYLNRDLSWIEFNRRVLKEAQDPDNPLMERARFLAIVSSNLDEFISVRVAGIQDQIRAGYTKKISLATPLPGYTNVSSSELPKLLPTNTGFSVIFHGVCIKKVSFLWIMRISLMHKNSP